jgi:hypothetical protein
LKSVMLTAEGTRVMAQIAQLMRDTMDKVQSGTIMPTPTINKGDNEDV